LRSTLSLWTNCGIGFKPTQLLSRALRLFERRSRSCNDCGFVRYVVCDPATGKTVGPLSIETQTNRKSTSSDKGCRKSIWRNLPEVSISLTRLEMRTETLLGESLCCRPSHTSGMLRTVRKSLVILLLAAISPFASAKSIPADAWQTGTLVDSSESWHTRGGGVITGNQYGTHGAVGSHEYPIVQYTIESSTYVYQVDLVLHRDRDKRPSVTVKGPIRFAIQKSDFYIQDEQGKEYKLVLDKKTLRAAQ
jgi:hypothetical protein